MTPLLRPRAVIFALLFAVAASAPFFTSAGAKRNRFFLEITATTTAPGAAQIFYDLGRGFNAEDSTAVAFPAGAKPVTLRFDLPPGSYRGLRFDPIDRDAVVTLANARVVDKAGTILLPLAPDQFHVLQQVALLNTRGSVLEIHPTPGASDPSLAITLREPFRLRAQIVSLILASAGVFSAAFLGFLAMCALPIRHIAASRLGKIIPWSQSHPGRAIALGSLLAVVVQCHPVIFFGKSFVSPDHGGALLYDHFPVLPGYQTTLFEKIHGSDVGALMFWHLYSPVVAHDALFRDHELPLWNRYSMSGVPLLGQGQSMLGDPLNWLSIATRSAAWSWDVRFVIARWLLCCGLGLTVWLLTRHLAASLLIAFGAAFLGFFGFRLNHPANFSLCYAPWILFAWVRLCQTTALRPALRGCLLLVVANACVLTSGTVKEAYLLVACLNFAGLLLLLLSSERSWSHRFRWLALTAGSGVVLGLITAPLWLSFLSTLQRSTTIYDQPAASQAPFPLLIGFFDDLFSRQTRPDENVYLPAMNFLFLLGVLWALVSLRELAARRAFVAIGLAALLPFAMVFGFIPAALITRLPFVAQIIHIDNTLSCPLIILAALLAGFGFSTFFQNLGSPVWKHRFAFFVLLLGGLGGLYVVFTHAAPKSLFFTGYAWSLIIALIALALGLRSAHRKSDPALFAAVFLGGFVLLTWRHAQYLATPFDDYVFNPKIRVDLHPPSPAVAFVDAQQKEPSRPIGFGLNLFPGYHQMIGWESIIGVDALGNRTYEELATSLGIERVRTADAPLPEGEQTPEILPGLNVLNVRYYLATHTARPHPIPGLSLLGRFDLDVYESEKAWPRAFFTDRLWRYDDPTPEAFARQVRHGDQRPFAAITLRDPSLPKYTAKIPPELNGRTVRPARNYRLTNNTTSFEIDAPSAGVIVLTETYYPDEFQVTVNGKPQDYFRVNHAFKGITVAVAGTYRIQFVYWPHNLTLALILAAIGSAFFAVVFIGSFASAKT